MTGATVLVVEDESVVAKDIQSSLKNMGYAVVGVTATGEDAITKAAELKPNLVLMDVMLKGKLDGIEAAHQIRARLHIPVVYLTAYTDDATLKRAIVSEAFGYLLKPFEDHELRTMIEMALYKHTMERKLMESHEWLETTLRCISDAMIATSAEGRIQSINPVAQELTGWSHADALGRKMTDVFCLKDTQDEILAIEKNMAGIMREWRVPASGKSATLISKTGKQTPIDHSMAPLRDESGAVLGVVITFRDITERQKAEERERSLYEKLSRLKRMESLGNLAGGVAHNLNNILGPIVSYPDLISKSLPADSPVRADLDMIKNSAQKAVDMLRDLLTLGRIGHFPMQPLQLNGIVEACLQSASFQILQRNTASIQVETRLAPELPPIMGSEQHLHELVMNLVLNGFNAMPDGGRLTIAAAAEEVAAPLEKAETIEPGKYVVLRVTDTGAGFEAEALSRIFEPFYAHKKAGGKIGSGLALAVVYGVVKEHKGYIDVHSAVGQGTEFTLYLPASGQALETVAKPEQKELQGAETILLVDDDEEQRKQTMLWLKSAGYTVMLAPNGRAAIEMIETAARGAGPAIDLIVLDMIMADDLDGLDTYKKIIEFRPGQKAILVSGFSMTERIKEAMTLGIGQYMQKPYAMEDLGRTVRRELDKPAENG